LFPQTSGPIDVFQEFILDFGQGGPEVTAERAKTLCPAGRHRVTLVVWASAAGADGWTEKIVQAVPLTPLP